MNIYAEAVKAGGDNWNVYMPDVMASSHAVSNLTPADRDDYRMFMAEKYKGPLSVWRNITFGPL